MDGKHILILLLMIATAVVLVAGVTIMMIGGKLNAKYGNKLMVWRVGLQGLTILLLAAMFATHGK